MQNVPFYYRERLACFADYTHLHQRRGIWNARCFGTGIYPLNRFDRLEIGLGLNSLNRAGA